MKKEHFRSAGCIRRPNIDLERGTPLSLERIKELTMSRIKEEKKPQKRRMTFKVVMAAAVIAALAASVFAAFLRRVVKRSFPLDSLLILSRTPWQSVRARRWTATP